MDSVYPDDPRPCLHQHARLGSALALARAGDHHGPAIELKGDHPTSRKEPQRQPGCADAAGQAPGFRLAAVAYRVFDGADALHRHADHVARLQRRGSLRAVPSPELGEAAAAAGAGAQHIAGPHHGVLRGVGHQLGERPAHVGEQVLADGFAVDFHGHGDRQEALGVVQVLELVRGDNPGPEGIGEVLALARARG